MIPKFSQGILVSYAGNVVMGAAEDFDRHVVDQSGQAAGAVDGNHTKAVTQENGQGDIMDVSDTAFEFGVFFDKAFNVAPVVDKAAVHRMRQRRPKHGAGSCGRWKSRNGCGLGCR